MRRVKRYLACLLSVCLLAGSVEFPAMAAESSVAVQEVMYAEGTTAGDDVSEGDVSKGDGAEGDGSGSSVSVNEVQSRIKSEEYETFVHVNPLYEDYVTDEVLAQWQAKAREQIYTADTQIESNTQEEAVAIIRDAMIARQTSLTVKVELDDAPSMSTTQFGKQLLYEAYADDPAGAGNAGDYLRSHYYGCTVGASISGGVKVVITYNYSFNYLSTAAQEQAVASKLSEVYAELNLGVLSGEAKVGKIYDYITNHVTYDYDHLDDGASVYPTAWSAYGGLIDGTCVCQGYASLVYRMMRESGVPARIITGYAGGDHAWNIVAIDGLYYNVDATWDAYTVNSDGSVNQPGQRTWYLLSTADFGNHARAEEYLTAEFQIAHPMAANSYGNATGNPDEMIELDNLSYEFTTSDNGKTSTTSSNGEFVLMVFGRVDCDYTMGYVEALVDAGITKNSNVRTLLVDIKNSLSDVQNRADDLDGDGVIVCYGAGSNGKTAMWDYCSLCGYDELSLEFPVVVLVDNNNKVRYFAVTAISIVGAKSCLQNLMQYEAPVIQSAEVVSGGIKLTWDAVNNADKYHVYSRIKEGAEYSKVATVTDTTYTYAVSNAGTYSLGVSMEHGSIESPMSEPVDVEYTKGAIGEVRLSQTETSLFSKQSTTLTATVVPVMSDDTVDQSVTWTSSDESVATVSNGTVTAVKPGSVTITATSVKDATKKATCAVTVKNDYIITYELNGGTLKTANPTAYNPFYPALALNAPEREGYGFLGWYRDANFAENTRMENIPAGSDYGNITLHAKWFECAAPVINNAEASLQGITLTWSALDQADKYYVYRKGANDANYTKVGNTTATTYLDKVTEAGTYYYVLTAEYDGKESGYSAVKEVLYQKGLVKEVTLNRTDASLFTYETVSLSATVAPVMSGDTVDQSVTWTSSDESVATVSNGTVTAVKPGSVTITATSVKDATKKATCAVTVKNDYIITYELNGGTLNTANPTAYNPFYPELVLYAPEKADANFVGWYRDENFAEDTRMTTIPKGSDWGNITLYAKWKEKARVATPVTNIPSGVVEQGTKIKLSSDTLDAMIYYTVNGTDPDRNSTRYTDTIVVNEAVEIRAFAVKEGYKDSAVAVFNYTVQDTSLDLGDVLPEDVPDSGVIPEGLWVAGVEDTTYTGKAITFDLHVYHGKKRLALKTDYTVSYKNNKVAAEATAKKAPTVTVTGKGNYKDKVVKNFTIAPVNIRTTAGFDVEESYVAYNGKKQNVVPVLYQDGKKLKVKKDYQVSYPDTSEGAYTEPGTYEIILTGIGNYCDEFKTTVTISKAKLMSKTKIAAIPAQPYNNGEEIEPAIVVKDGRNVVDPGMYTVEYKNNSEIGTATVTITGDGIHYFGYKKATFKITGVAMSKVKVENLAKSMPYTGEEVVQNGLKLTYTAKKGEAAVELLEGRDYTVEYAKNVSAGTASITFKGMGRYTGNLKKTFKITAFDLKTNESSLVTVNYAQSLPYAKGGVKPEVQVFFAGTELVAGKDYTVSYKNNKAVNDGSNVKKLPTIAIKGKGNFKGTANYTFTITKQDIALMDVQVADKLVYTKAGGFKSTPKLYDVDGKQLKAGTDYEKNIGYYYEEDTYLEDGVFRAEGEAIGSRDILPAGTVVRVEVTGKGNYEANVVSGRYRIVKADVAKATVKIDPQIYTGKAVEPGKDQIKVTLKGVELTPADYEIVSYKNNVKKGTATVVLRGVGEYGGTKTAKFTIAARSIGDAEFYNELEEEYGH